MLHAKLLFLDVVIIDNLKLYSYLHLICIYNKHALII